MGAVLSYLNDCPYCADMLVSLVHGSGKHHAASSILDDSIEAVTDPTLRARLAWVREIADVEREPETPFSTEELPEAIGTLFTLNYVNRFSHVVMDGSPVQDTLKNTSLRLFGYELRETTERPIEPGRGIDLLAPAPVPDDMAWALPNPRIADALARWGAVVERESALAISQEVSDVVLDRIGHWRGERMPLSRTWVEPAVENLDGDDYHAAKLALIVAMASHQFDESLLKGVMADGHDEERLIRILSFAAFSAARRLAEVVSERVDASARAAA